MSKQKCTSRPNCSCDFCVRSRTEPSERDIQDQLANEYIASFKEFAEKLVEIGERPAPTPEPEPEELGMTLTEFGRQGTWPDHKLARAEWDHAVRQHRKVN